MRHVAVALCICYFFSVFSRIIAFTPRACNSKISGVYYRSSMSERLQLLHQDKEDGDRKKEIFPPYLPTFGTAALGGLLFGSDIGCTSSVVRIFGSNIADLGAVDSVQLGLIASISLFGAMAASFILIISGDKQIGRKLELQIASVLYTIGTLAQSLAPSLVTLLIGRLVYGLGIGVAMHVAPLYIAETSPDNMRGKLVSYKEAAIVAGIVLGYAAGAIFGSTGEGSSWRSVYESVLPLEALMVAGSFIVPESARWLALRGRPQEAVLALQQAQFLSFEEASMQVDGMMLASASIASSSATPSASPVEEDTSVIARAREIIDSPYNARALVIGVGLVLFQQLSGQPSVLYFANRIFQDAGLGFEAALGVGLFKLFMTIVSAALVEDPKWGRRPLLLWGNTGVTFSLTCLSVLYQFASPADNPTAQAAVIASILLFVGSYQIGFGPITWLVLSEIFPLRVRGAAVSIGTLANFGSNLLVASFFEVERQSLGESALFFQFAVIALAATLFTNAFVFETRGLSLEQIEEKLKNVVDESAGRTSS